MDYGKQIRLARDTLKIFQREIADENLSRNLLSDIEKGKVNLVPSKAWIIYKKIIEIAWNSGIYYELEFDAVLEDFEAYRLMKHANHICKSLQDMTTGIIAFDRKFLMNASKLAAMHEVGLLRFHIYLLTARVYRRNNLIEEAADAYLEAMDFMRWQMDEKVCEQYETCLKEATAVLYDIRRYEGLLKCTLNYFKLSKGHKIEVGPSWLFNIGLYYQKLQIFDQSNEYLMMFLEQQSQLEDQDILDAKILIGINMIEIGDFETGIGLYREVIEDCQSEYKHQKTLAYSNAIFILVKDDSVNHTQEIKNYIEVLEGLVASDDEVTGVAKINIGLAYQYMGKYNQAIESILDGMETLIKFRRWPRLIDVINDTFAILAEKGHINDAVTSLLAVSTSELGQKDYITYLEVLIKIQSLVGHKGYTDQLDRISRKLLKREA